METASSAERVQKVVFCRHGVAKHNLLDPVTGGPPNLEDPSLFDPPLVCQGKQQALGAGERLKIWWHTTQLGEEVELIITSPLTRCIQTSMLAFLPGDSYTSSHGRLEPSFFCTEYVREAFGMHYPDKRRQKSLLQKHWPTLKFDTHMTEDDQAWSPRSRETIDQLQDRVAEFLSNCLVQRPETNIVIVSHGVWIEACFHRFCPEALDHGKRRVYNCDIFAGDCVSKNGKFVRLQNMQQIH